MEQVTENTEEEGREPGGPAPGPRESGLLWDPVLLQVSLHCRLNIRYNFSESLNRTKHKHNANALERDFDYTNVMQRQRDRCPSVMMTLCPSSLQV